MASDGAGAGSGRVGFGCAGVDGGAGYGGELPGKQWRVIRTAGLAGEATVLPCSFGKQKEDEEIQGRGERKKGEGRRNGTNVKAVVAVVGEQVCLVNITGENKHVSTMAIYALISVSACV